MKINCQEEHKCCTTKPKRMLNSPTSSTQTKTTKNEKCRLCKNRNCYILQPKADHQGSKITSGDFKWIGPHEVENVLPNEKYIVGKIITSKTQNLNRIGLRKNTTGTLLEDNSTNGKIRTDDSNVISQNNMYSIVGEAESDPSVLEHRKTYRDPIRLEDTKKLRFSHSKEY